MIIVSDVDLVAAPSDVPWLAWLNSIAGTDLQLPFTEGDSKYHYDLSKYFPDFESKYGVCPFSFWDNHTLYDTLPVKAGSGSFYKQVVETGDNIVFCSHTKGPHFSSKYRYLKLRYPFIDFSRESGNGFIATKEKHLVRADVAIDDRAENLIYFPDETIKIYFSTKYSDPLIGELKKKPNVFITSVENAWEDVTNIVYFQQEKF